MRAVASISAFTVARDRACEAFFLGIVSGFAAIFSGPICEYQKRAIARIVAPIERRNNIMRDTHLPPVDTLQRLFRYKAWANNELLTELAALGDTSPVVNLAVKALSHTYIVDRIFAAHLRGEPHTYLSANSSGLPTLADLSADIAASDQESPGMPAITTRPSTATTCPKRGEGKGSVVPPSSAEGPMTSFETIGDCAHSEAGAKRAHRTIFQDSGACLCIEALPRRRPPNQVGMLACCVDLSIR
jgi:hypothetical protein